MQSDLTMLFAGAGASGALINKDYGLQEGANFVIGEHAFNLGARVIDAEAMLIID